MVGNNSFWSNSGVSSNNSRRVRLLGRLLGASGGDGLGTVLDDLNINDLLADSLGNLPWGGDGNLVAGPDWDTGADRGRGGNWGSITVSSIGISISLSISFTLSASGMGNASNKAGTNNSSVSNDSSVSNNSSMSNSTISSTNKSTSCNSAISSTMDSMSSNTVGNSHFWGGNNTGCNNLGVMANNTGAMSGLG